MSIGSILTAIKCIVVVLVYILITLIKRVLAAVGLCKCGQKQHQTEDGKVKRVAIIGGGIAGCSAAWSAARSGECEVTLFEARPILGGNAKTHVWEGSGKKSPSGEDCRTGLSVLAWPEKYFRHYEALLKFLNIPITTVQPKYVISTDGKEAVYTQGEDTNTRWTNDMQRWDRSIKFIRSVNDVCAWVTSRVKALVPFGGKQASGNIKKTTSSTLEPSFYEVAMINPMNLISARKLTKYFFGVSDDFWNCVVVPVYSSSFLTAELDHLPALILPALDDIISVGAKEPLKPLHTWQRTSKEVFDKMAADIGEKNIVLNADLQKVKFVGDHWDVVFAGGSKSQTFDYVIFACPATAVDSLTEGTQVRDPLFNSIIPHVTYENERDDNFVTGTIHTERDALPKKLHPLFFGGKEFTNYVRVVGDPSKGVLENTFALSPWVPAAKAARPSSTEYHDFYVTYNPTKDNKCAAKKVGEVDNSWAHPQFTLTNLALAFMMPMLQGRNNAYYCACYTTPGNGHDLSLLSGFVVASQITKNGFYPFQSIADAQTRKDYDLLTDFLGF